MLEKDYAHGKPSEAAIPSRKTLAQLKSLGLQKLGDIVRSRSVDDQHRASSRSELIAAKELLNRFEKSQ
jgi:hypothetical protein